MQQEERGGKPPDKEGCHGEGIREEKIDPSGRRWRKVYTGGGAHLRHWLEQFKEIYSEENLSVEEEDPAGFACFEHSGEKMYSVWLRICPEAS